MPYKSISLVVGARNEGKVEVDEKTTCCCGKEVIESQDFIEGFLSTVISGRLMIPSAKTGLVSFTRRRIRKVTVRCRFGGTVNIDIQVRRVPFAGTVAFIEFLYPPSKFHLTAISLELRQ